MLLADRPTCSREPERQCEAYHCAMTARRNATTDRILLSTEIVGSIVIERHDSCLSDGRGYVLGLFRGPALKARFTAQE